MRSLSVLSLLLFLPLFSFAQVSDDFEDDDLLNPDWSGDIGDFTVEDGRLRLMADGSGLSELRVDLGSTDPSREQEMMVEFLVDMAFAPSGSNFCAIRLERLQMSGPNTLRRFVELRFGGESGDQDALTGQFFDVDQTPSTGRGTDGALGMDPATARVRLTKTLAGTWTVAADYTGGRNFTDEFTLEAPDFIPETFVLTCEYTSTRADKMSFDDLSVNVTVAADEAPPSISFTNVIDAQLAVVHFSEDVTAQRLVDYNLSLAGNAITAVDFLPGRRNEVAITFADPLVPGEAFTVGISNLTDLAGNVADPLTAEFRYAPAGTPAETGLTITEFMPDPNPVVGLPDAEYIELHNPSADLFTTLNGIGIRSGTTERRYFGNAVLEPGGYVTLVRADDAAAFTALDIPTLVLDFPALTNSGDDVSLVTLNDTLLTLDYTSAWYNDTDRDDGGYSIEFTGGSNLNCGGLWRASLDPAGGTPGAPNSVAGMLADVAPPIVVGSNVDPDGITVVFDEPTTTDFSLIDGPAVTSVTSGENDTEYRIGFDAELEPGVRYTLRVDPPEDCAGNTGEPLEIQLGIPGEPEAGDVIINEILFNPESGGTDFVEIRNLTDQFFQIEGWELANTQSTSSGATRTIEANRLLAPREYLVLTDDPQDIAARYESTDLSLVVEQTLPSLPDDEGNITLRAEGLVLDAFDYSDDFHSRLLDDDDGVSLERRRFGSLTQDRNNWFSAAASVGFGTPTQMNSQEANDPIDVISSFALSSETFSPDGDGFEDQLEIQYAFDGGAAGRVVRIRIFDAQGRTVRVLRDAELLGTTGVISWDGSTDDGDRARAGIHVVNIEVFAEGMMTETERLVAVVAGPR